MPTTTLPVVDGGPPAGKPTGGRDQREGVIRAGVLAALGRPGALFRVAVTPLWGDRYRVNVMTGEDTTSVRIAHSYFLAADGRGNILESTPSIRREYERPPAERGSGPGPVEGGGSAPAEASGSADALGH